MPVTVPDSFKSDITQNVILPDYKNDIQKTNSSKNHCKNIK